MGFKKFFSNMLGTKSNKSKTSSTTENSEVEATAPALNMEALERKAMMRAYNYCLNNKISTKSVYYRDLKKQYLEQIIKEEEEALQKRIEEERRAKELEIQRLKELEEKHKKERAAKPPKTDDKPKKVASPVPAPKAKEELIDVVKALSSSLEVRRKNAISVVSRVNTFTDGNNVTYWFLPGGPISLYDAPELKALGRFVPKRSYVAIQIQTQEPGSTFSYNQINNIKRMENHTISIENKANLEDRIITLAGDDTLYQYRNIKEFLEGLQLNQDQIKETKTEIGELELRVRRLTRIPCTGQQRAQLTRKINKLKDSLRILTLQREDLRNITIYIRKQGEIRHTHIIDPIQTGIMSQNLFDGKTIVIEGGPGTGKTTTMIHRLGYLTEVFAIEADQKEGTNIYKLDRTQRKELLKAIEEQRDWMFFSPSAMLKKYLADAMQKEGLKNTSLKVWNWDDYCKYSLQANYRLLESSGNNAPFKTSYKNEVLFYHNSGVINELNTFFVEQLLQNMKSLPDIGADGNRHDWAVIAKRIKSRFENPDNHKLSRLIELYKSLQALYAADCKTIVNNNRTKIEELADDLFLLVEANDSIKENIQFLLNISLPDEEIEQEEDANDGIVRDAIWNELKNWIKSYSKCLVQPGAKLTQKQLEITDELTPLLTEEYTERLRRIGDIVIFEQYAKHTNGVCNALLGGIPAMYKSFRHYLQTKSFDGCNLVLLKELSRNGGKELHYQERSLLLGFINNLVKQILSSGVKDAKHYYIDAYRELARPIIGVDEATDFCDCDIYAMESLLTQGFSSMTLCGDMMQRLTPHGIDSWNELNGLVANPTVVKMKTSYRQSTKLIDLARSLYYDTIGTTPNYKAFMSSKKVPVPLAFVSENEFGKIDWIGKRIEEVYRAYGDLLPSVAVFVNDKGEILRFIEYLKQKDFFVKNGIEVLDGTVDKPEGIENYICVYPIDIVKGMEFDVVFFHNIDRDYVDADLLKRYIYVGVSRAAFFLGITLSEWKDDLCKYFETDKDWFNI